MKSLENIKFEDLFNLRFFANRFHVAKEKLSWAVVVSKTKETTTCFPAIMIKGEKVYINMSSDALAPLVNICGSKQTICKATPKEIDANTIAFVFENDKTVGLDKDRFFSTYRNKIFSVELAKEAERLN